jgi:hypothetical protein
MTPEELEQRLLWLLDCARSEQELPDDQLVYRCHEFWERVEDVVQAAIDRLPRPPKVTP